MSDRTEQQALTAINECPKCRALPPDEKRARLTQILDDVAYTRARVLTPFPATAWPKGRAPK